MKEADNRLNTNTDIASLSTKRQKTIKAIHSDSLNYKVRKKGLEPPRREAPDPKSGAATNYATSAFRIFRVGKDRVISVRIKCFCVWSRKV